ncbi:MAG: hypothetical protein JWO54_189 [Candidatus Saccharibacteria bacterium]|nr:hypothetical protein [Candidatus Saccharibacteria bacterium]
MFERHKELIVRLTKFLLSGGTAALVEYVVFLLLQHFMVGLLIANSISFLCGFVVSFILNRSWVFSSNGAVKKQLGSYTILAGINFLISNGVLWLLVEALNIPSPVAKLFTMVMIACWNYVLFSKIIFKNKK